MLAVTWIIIHDSLATFITFSSTASGGVVGYMHLTYGTFAALPSARLHHTRRVYLRSATRRSLTKAHHVDKIYVATVPLVGWESIETSLRSAFPHALALHCMVLIQSELADAVTVTVFDFLPQSPASPITAARLLAGGSVLGVLRERQLSKLPSTRCWHVASASQPEAGLLNSLLLAVL